MPTPIFYDPDSDKYLGTNEQGHTEVWDKEDVPQAMKLGKVLLHRHPSEDAPVEPPQKLFDPNSPEEKAKGPPVRVQPEDETPVHLDPVQQNQERAPAPPRPSSPAPRADADPTGFSGGSPSQFFGDALDKTATARLPEQPIHSNPSIPGVRPNTGSSSKVAGASESAPGSSAEAPAAPPPGYGPELDDKALQRAQEQARANHLMAGIGRAGATIGAAFGRVAPDHSYFDEEDKTAGQPVTDLMTRRGAMDQEQGRQGRAQALGDASNARQAAREMSDPASDRSQRARQVLMQANPEFAKRFSPEEFARMSANDIGNLGELGKTVLTHTMDLEKADKEKQAGISAESARQQAAFAQQERERQAREEFEGRQRGLDRQNHRATAMEGARAQALAYKKQQNSVFGFEPINPDKALLPQQAASLADAVMSRDQILSKLDELKQLHRRAAHALPNSREMADQKALIAELQPSLAKLNNFNLTQGHQELQSHVLSDPSALGAWLNSGVMDTQIDRLKKTAHEAVATHAHALGQREVQEEQPAAAAGDLVRVRAPDGSVHQVHKSKLEKAMAAGGKLVPDA